MGVADDAGQPDPDDGLGLPPLPTLRPLSIFRPFTAMTGRPVPDMPPAAPAVPPVAVARAAAAVRAMPVVAADPIAEAAPEQEPATVTEPATATVTEPATVPEQEPATAPIPVVTAAGAGADGYAVVSSPPQTPVSEPATGAGGASDTEMPPRIARGAVSILLIGGAGPLRDAVAHRLAAHGAAVVLHTSDADHAVTDGLPGGHRFAEADPSDTDAMIRLVSRAAVPDDDPDNDAEASLRAVIVLPATRDAVVPLSGTTEAFSDALAGALSAEVLGVAAAMHAAVRQLADADRPGRLVIVTAEDPNGGRRPGSSLAGALGSAAMAVLGEHLATVGGPGVGVIHLAAADHTPAAGSVDRTIEGLADAVVLAVGPLLDRPGLQPVSGTVLRLRL